MRTILFVLVLAASPGAAAERTKPSLGAWCGDSFVTFLEPGGKTLTLRKTDIFRILILPDGGGHIGTWWIDGKGQRKLKRYPFGKGLMFDFIVECLD